MRTISLLCTQLPAGYTDNNKRCRSANNHTDQKWDVIAWRVLSQAGKLGFQVFLKLSNISRKKKTFRCQNFSHSHFLNYFEISFFLKVLTLKSLIQSKWQHVC